MRIVRGLEGLLLISRNTVYKMLESGEILDQFEGGWTTWTYD